MNDTISRQAAIDLIKNDAFLVQYAWGGRGHKPEMEMVDDLVESIIKQMKESVVSRLEQMPSAQPEQRWIPCSERLPEVYEAGNSVSGMFMQSRPVLVYGVPEYESEHGFHVVTYCDDLNGITYWSTELDAVTINEVIAWMPLPEPYRAERREDE